MTTILARSPASQASSGAPVNTPQVSPHQQNAPQSGFVNRRHESDFAAAHRHSKIVRFLKKALPAGAALVFVVFIANIFISSSKFGGISIVGADFQDGKLVMNAPTMAGFDSKNRPYDVSAQRAIQDPTTPSVVTLENINALLPLDEKNKARIVAAKGIYNSDKETMILSEKILVTGARGMEIEMTSADIDIKTGALKSNERVSVRSEDAQISADSVEVSQNGANILFKNRVRMTINSSALHGDN